jgi:hypothetical protein
MANLSFQFAPPNFGDWTTYAGFDRKTGQQEDSRLAQTAGVAPPSSMEELGKMAIAPYTQQFNKIQTAFGQATTGDFGGAYGTMKQKQTAPSSGFDFSENPH